MKVIPITNKTSMIRHWGKWYTVTRGVADWAPLKIGRYKRPFSVQKAIDGLSKTGYNKSKPNEGKS